VYIPRRLGLRPFCRTATVRDLVKSDLRPPGDFLPLFTTASSLLTPLVLLFFLPAKYHKFTLNFYVFQNLIIWLKIYCLLPLLPQLVFIVLL